jgi:hypothetical protein
MPNTIGYVDNANGQSAHYNMLQKIRDFASANGWQVLRYVTNVENRELILKGTGLSGTEEIFVGFRTYQDASADYYNLVAAVFTGYVASNTFDTQPGAYLSGVPAHNNRIDYWLTLNGQRIALAMKVGTPVYESAYVGKILPYGRPSQYPYPVACGGMLQGATATRFSDASHSMPYKGNRSNFGLRTNDGWKQPYTYPWQNVQIASQYVSQDYQLRDTGNSYPLLPIELNDNTSNLWGALDGIHYISGFNNAVENTFALGGVTYVVMQDVARTAHIDYYAMRMDA